MRRLLPILGQRPLGLRAHSPDPPYSTVNRGSPELLPNIPNHCLSGGDHVAELHAVLLDQRSGVILVETPKGGPHVADFGPSVDQLRSKSKAEVGLCFAETCPNAADEGRVFPKSGRDRSEFGRHRPKFGRFPAQVRRMSARALQSSHRGRPSFGHIGPTLADLAGFGRVRLRIGRTRIGKTWPVSEQIWQIMAEVVPNSVAIGPKKGRSWAKRGRCLGRVCPLKCVCVCLVSKSAPDFHRLRPLSFGPRPANFGPRPANFGRWRLEFCVWPSLSGTAVSNV